MTYTNEDILGGRVPPRCLCGHPRGSHRVVTEDGNWPPTGTGNAGTPMPVFHIGECLEFSCRCDRFLPGEEA